jgi:hypothetical protein
MPPKPLRRADFISRSVVAFGDRFDYPETELDNGVRSRVTIVCRQHGPFSQLASSHLRGEVGFVLCVRGDQTLTLDEFLQRAAQSHGDRFNYSRTSYVRMTGPVTITCRKHGPFNVTPQQHLTGPGGCPGCKGGRLSTREFIARSRGLFGDKYDYGGTTYTTNSNRIRLVCTIPNHGPFEQLAESHLTGKEGCPDCTSAKKHKFGIVPIAEDGRLVSSRSSSRRFENRGKRLSQEAFIERSRDRHSDAYGYNNARYETQYDPVLVTCPVHGDFPVSPTNHWKGTGCQSCARKRGRAERRLGPDEFVTRAKLKHGDRYEYSESRYVQARVQVEIGCGVHGSFRQLPFNHLAGRGCRMCAQDAKVALLNESARLSRELVRGGRPNSDRSISGKSA